MLGAEFLNELRAYGHIYMYRFRPVHFEMKAYPIQCYPAKTTYGRCLQLMIMNNLDPRVAQFPHELVSRLPYILHLFLHVDHLRWKWFSFCQLGTILSCDEVFV